MFRPLTLGCLFVAVSAAATYADAPPEADVLDIKVKHIVGHELHHRVQTKTVGTMQFAPGMPAQKFSQLYEMDVKTRCLKVLDDGAGVFEITMPRIAMEMQLGGLFKMSYASDADTIQASDNQGAGIVKAMFDAMTKVKFESTIGPDNQPREVKGLSEGIRKVLNDSLGKDLAPQERQFFEQLSTYLNDDQMKEYFKSTGRMLPNRKIKRGEKWTENWDMVLPVLKQPLSGSAEYTFTDVREKRGRQCARITNSMSFKQGEDNAVAMDAPGGLKMQMAFKINNGMGEAYFDVNTWDLMECREVQDMTIDITVVQPAHDENSEPTETSMHQKFKQTTHMWLVDDEQTEAEAATTKPAE